MPSDLVKFWIALGMAIFGGVVWIGSLGNRVLQLEQTDVRETGRIDALDVRLNNRIDRARDSRESALERLSKVESEASALLRQDNENTGRFNRQAQRDHALDERINALEALIFEMKGRHIGHSN